LASKVACLPYDVVTTEEARAYAKGNPQCFFHISRPEIGLPPGTDEHGESVYRLGRENLLKFQDRQWLIQDPAPALYLYQQRMGQHSQVGVVGVASVAEYERELIKKHERTRPDKEDDRTRHIEILEANDEPVFLTYRARPDIDALVARLRQQGADFDFVSEDGIGHTFWTIPRSETARVQRMFEEVPALYVADGHHRSAAASRVRAQAQQKERKPGNRDFFLTVVFPHNQMQILDYNRTVKDLHGLSAKQLLEKLALRFEVKPAAQGKPERPHQFGMFLQGTWYRLIAKPGSFDESPLGVLDVSILQNNLLGPILGIGDPRTDKRIHFVGGIRGIQELEKGVQAGQSQVAFALYPTSLEQVMAIADAGQIMPPKSTWFEPKLRSGLVLHLFES
jgi:uncharacterized protein (DUF1015 family)